MSPNDLESYLHDRIPLARAMQIVVDSVSDEEVVLAAPLAPNKNHRGTLFGGSAAAAATLAAWALLTILLRDKRVSESLLIQKSNLRYDLPVEGDFRARATLASPENWQRFVDTLGSRKRARVTVSAALEQEGLKAVRFTGTFVAVAPPRGKRAAQSRSHRATGHVQNPQ